jgi:HEAT repeat protein
LSRKLTPVGLCFALSCALLAGQKLQPVTATGVPHDSPKEPVANIPNFDDAPATANRLVLAFRDPSALNRVELLEQVDASTAFDQPAAVSLLHESLYDEDQLVREAALRALTRRDSTANPVLGDADVAPFQGENAELARVHFAAKNEDTATLRDLIQSGDAVVQQGAFEALAATDVSGAVEALRAELRDAHSLYRLQTLDLLAGSAYTSSSNELLPTLRELTQDQDPLVRDYAKRLLRERN